MVLLKVWPVVEKRLLETSQDTRTISLRTSRVHKGRNQGRRQEKVSGLRRASAFCLKRCVSQLLSCHSSMRSATLHTLSQTKLPKVEATSMQKCSCLSAFSTSIICAGFGNNKKPLRHQISESRKLCDVSACANPSGRKTLGRLLARVIGY